jgi:pimeloyl-ACP methyl ester carboxylesterase
MGADRLIRRVHLATGVTVSYLEQGDPQAVAVLLLHAWVESSGCFDRLLQAVPPALRVFAMDQRGHGDADKPADGYALVNFADDIEAFMDAVGLQSAVLLGSSSGGYIAQQVAIQVPHRVGGLVLVGAPRSLQGRPAFADEVDRLTDPVDPTWVEESLTWFPRYHDVPDRYIKDRIRDGLRVPAHVWMASLAGLTTAVPPSESGTITAPTLIICGERTSYCRWRTDTGSPQRSPAPGLSGTRTRATWCCGSSPNEWPPTWPTSAPGFQRRVRTARRSRKVRPAPAQRDDDHAPTTSAAADQGLRTLWLGQMWNRHWDQPTRHSPWVLR